MAPRVRTARLAAPLTYGLWRSLVSALVWGTRGPEFKSRQPDHSELVLLRRGVRSAACRPDTALAGGTGRPDDRRITRPPDQTTAASRASACGVRVPHHTRSLPSTKTTGAICSSSARWRSEKGYGSDGAITRSGRSARRFDRHRRIHLRSAEDVLDADVGEQARPVRRSAEGDPRPPPDRHERTGPHRGWRGKVVQHRVHVECRGEWAELLRDVVDRADVQDPHAHACIDQRVVVLAAVLLGVDDHDVGTKCSDRNHVRILRPTDVRHVGLLAKARAGDRCDPPLEERLGHRRHQADHAEHGRQPARTPAAATHRPPRHRLPRRKLLRHPRTAVNAHSTQCRASLTSCAAIVHPSARASSPAPSPLPRRSVP